MAKENHKKVLAMLLAASIAVPTPVLAVSPSDFKDFPDNWAKAALSYSVSNGLLSGSDGMIRPNDSLTRAEMAAIINRLAGAKETTSLTNYADVSPSAWYYQDMGKAVQMGTFVGDGGNLRPEAAITRQEVFSVLARYYCLESANTDVLKKYADMQQIGSWALESTAAMVEAGYIHGDGEKLNPVAPITRAEFAQVIRNVAGTIVDANSSVSETVSGNLVVRGDNVVLKGTTIEGDLILADGADHTTLDGVTVKGRIVIRGGAKGVEIKNSKSDKGVIVSNPNKDVVISASDSQLGTVILRSDVDLSGEYEKIVVEKQLDVSLDEGKVSKLVVEKTAKSASVQVAENGVVNDIVVNAPDVNIAGEGAVSQVFANGNGIQISTKNTKVTTGNNVSGVIAGGKEISANSSVTTEASTGDKTSSGSSSSSSGGSGGSSQKHDVYLASSWKELRQAVSKAKAGDIVRLSGNITDAGADTDVVLDGVSSATLPLNQKNLIFDGNGHTISAAEGKTFCFDVDGKGGETTGLEIRNLTVDGASFSAKLGGAFFVEDGTSVTFRNVTIKNSKANSGSDVTGGGAIFINDHGNPPQVQIIDCVFENNTVPNAENNGFVGRGGAIYANNFRSTSAVKLTVKDSVFRNNQAAYGGAIAADGVVDLVVENCTFEENSGTVGADDIYIYDGISTGKKNLTIASTVTATLLGNTYTNTSSDSDDMTAMNVIFGRYYPADFSGKPGVAPVGAIDLTFKDIQRTQVQDEVESIAMTKVELQGKDYYYGVPVNIGGTFITKFTVNGSEVAAEKIGDTNVYYYAAEWPTGTYYGTAEVPFADFYYGELSSVSKPEQTSIVTKTDAAAELRSEGEYDAVTSATTSKWNQYSTTYVQTNEDGTGSVLGLKTPVAVEASVYVQGMLLQAADVSSQNELISIVASMTDITTEPTQQYKTIYADGTLSAMDSQSASALTPSDPVTATISDQTPWGNYLIQVNNLPTDIQVKNNLLGIVLTDNEGNKYGIKQVDNLFLKSAGEISFAVEEFTEPHGNALQYQRFAELPGKTITSITYLTKGYQNFTIDNLNLYCGRQLTDEQLPVVTEKTAFESGVGATVKLDTSKLPYTGVELVSVKMGSGKQAVTLAKGTDYTFENNVLQILDTETTETGIFTITFADTNKESGYVSSSISVNLEDEISEPVGLSDGEWYGTGTYSLYYETKGPDVVRVNIKDGKIAGAYPVKHIEDEGFERGQDILDYVKNISTVEEINALEEQLANQKGAAYDAVSGATETAKGHLSAVKNAIQRSEKYTGDGVEQKVQWFDFATRPKELMYYGENLDLTGAVLSVYTKDGQTKEVPFNNLDDYGITTSIANGTMITESTPGLTFGKLQILFQQEAGLISMPTNVVAQKKTSKNLPSHLIIEFADGKTQRVELDDNEFNYEVAAVGDIVAIKMFDDDRELARATYYEEYGDWEFDLSTVEPGEGYSGWKYNNYYIVIDNSADTSAVASFTLDTNYLTTAYGAGYDLDLSSLGISLKTVNGSVQRIDGWDDCVARGFTAAPEDGYTFTKEDAKAGTKTIQIKNGDLIQSFDVTVIDYEKQIPAKIVLSNQEGTEIKTVTVELAEWKEASGMLSLYDIKMPEEYKDWNTDTIKVAIYNSDNELLNDYSISPYLSGKAMEINFPNYTEYDSYGGYVRLMFDFSDEGEQTGELSDGVWYGTGTWSRNYDLLGPDVVKVTITDGAISAVDSVKYTDDNYGVYLNGKKIMDYAVGLTEMSSLYTQLENKKGTAYDAVSGATETALGHLSAIDNALARSRQYANDQVDQQIAWMDFKTKPAQSANYNTPLDLSKAVLVLHLLNGEQNEVTFAQFEENGIATDYQNGTVITPETAGLNDDELIVKFTHALSQTSIPAQIVFLNEVNERVPSHILVTFVDNTTERIELSNTKFRYDLSTVKGISKVEIYDNTEKLADGVFEADYNEWKISLDGVSAGEGFTGWKFSNYYVNVDTSEDTSSVASFTLDTSLIPQQYSIGDMFDLSKISISLVTENGNPQHLTGWDACVSRGFTTDLAQGYTFTADDAGEKTITISAGDVTQTFKINVVDYASQVPAKVELYDADTNDLIQTIQVDAKKWQNDKGCVMLMGIELPDTYKGWTPDTFTVKIYNAKDEVVEDSLYTTGYDYYKEALEIDFPHYKEYYSEGGYLKLYFTLQPSVEPDPNVTAEGVATVEIFGYDAKVSVTYNKETGAIVSVSDNGTVPGGSNQSFWTKALAMFDKFEGKTAAEIDGIDAVSGATYSSDAIKEAVKNALPAATETVDAPTVKAQDLRTQMLFAATEPAVLQVSAPEGTEVYYTIDGSDPTTSESKQKMTDQTVSIEAASNEDSQMMVKLAANKNGTWSAVTEIPVSFVKIPESDTGTKVYLGQATCPGAEGQPYDVKVKVTTVNGQIALLEDNGTEPSGDSDYAFWWGWGVMESEGMPSKLKGKNLQQLLNARTTPSDDETVKVDAISGATLSSDAVKYATIAALRSQPIEEGQGEIAPPILQSEKLVAPNTSAGSISVVMTGTTGEEIHYTLDGSEPTIDSPAASDIPYTDDKGVVLKADKDTYPDGRVVVVKAAAFLDGKKSDTVTARYVFANANAEHSYERGTFQGSSDDVQVTVEIESPNFDQKYYITDIRLDDASQQAYRAFLPELLSQVYLKQGVDGVTAISGYETESQKVLSAIENALDQTFVAAQPVISVEPDASQYANDAQVTVSLSCPTQGAQIYYVVETSDDVSGTLSDFETNKKPYTDSFTVGIDNPDGGKVYLRAAAQTANGKLSEITRKDLDFVKGVNENAFTVDNQNYGTWAEAVDAVEEAGSGEIVLNDDVELLDSDTLPAVSCTIRSNDTQKYTITGSVLNAKADVTFDNVTYDINSIYANGHSVVIGADVETPFSFWNRSIYAGPSYDAEEKEITANPVITIESGTFALYGSGGGTTTVNGDVEIHIKGTASAEVGGAYMNAIVKGTVSVFVEGTATLEEFLGEQKDGQLEDIKLTIEGSPSLTGDTYIGSVNGTPKGTLDLQNATLTEEQIANFVDFKEILQAEANEILEAEVLTEILAPTQPAEDVLAKEPVTEEMSEAAVELPVEEKDEMPEIITALPAEQKEEVPEATVEILEAEDFESVEDLSKEEESILFVESEHLTE